ncbi:GNAT family N-acetyltransferase [Dactylosporangium vinaceum]|uniref:GNAT family N-acetyltransferase n=1 Tax=Dactylosporangium vinaceum TaxID=53362 RepID=A0ABV5MFN1_9ACTN|nr:GNAT family N-acetyltransferase [Dactylosporangium vinaceum]
MGISVRRATLADTDELIRLRIVMLSAMEGSRVPPGDWSRRAAAELHRRLPGPDASLAAFVVDRPDGPGLAACAVGTIDVHLGSPGNPDGSIGYIFNVATDEEYRRRGLSTACLEALLAWFGDRAVPTVRLFATPDGQSVYERLGFTRETNTAMRLKLGS